MTGPGVLAAVAAVAPPWQQRADLLTDIAGVRLELARLADKVQAGQPTDALEIGHLLEQLTIAVYRYERHFRVR